MAYQDFLIDKRIVQRNIDKGLVDPKQLEKQIAALPDRAENATWYTLEPETAAAEATGDEPAPGGGGALAPRSGT
jgi:hypothetical protein